VNVLVNAFAHALVVGRRVGVLCAIIASVASQTLGAQARDAAAQQISRGFATSADVTMRLYVPAGRVRVTTWARDSVHVRGTLSKNADMFGGGSRTHIKFGIETRARGDTILPYADWDVTVPAGSRLWLKMIDGDMHVAGVSGELELYAVRGAIVVEGVRGVTSVESIDAPVTVRDARGDVRVRGSRGRVALQDVQGTLSVATVSGPVSLTRVAAEGRVETIGGAIDVTGGSLVGAMMELQSHSGAISLSLDAKQVPVLDLSSRAGPILGDQLIGHAKHGQLMARSFKGRITVRAR
jgi:hypothetical protein